VGAGASRGPEPAEDACGRGVLRHVSVRRRCGRAEPRPCRPGGFTRERESSSVRVAASEFRADPASSVAPDLRFRAVRAARAAPRRERAPPSPAEPFGATSITERDRFTDMLIGISGTDG